MPLWSNTDSAAGSPNYVSAQFSKTPNTANRDALFGNTTADAFRTGQTVGVYGVDHAEVRATRADGEPRAAHSGWVLRTEGSGGRAGRVTHEVLVAMSGGMTADAENTVFQQFSVVVDTHPADASGNSAGDDIVTFDALGHAVPAQAVTYKWQAYGAGPFANVADAGAYSNTATAELSVLANVESDGEIYRCGIYSTGADTRFTSNAVITIT